MEIRWKLSDKDLGNRNEHNYVLKRNRYVRLNRVYPLNNEKWWKRYGLYTGMKFTSWRSGRWLGIQWNFENAITNI